MRIPVEDDEITFLTDSAFPASTESTGAKFVLPLKGADFDSREILSVAPELRDILLGLDWFRVALERTHDNSYRRLLDCQGGAAPCRVSRTEWNHGSRQSTPTSPVGGKKSRSPLARRVVNAKDDPAKRRIRHWLSDISDDRLLSFGLTAQDIVHLRGARSALAEGPRRP